MEHQSPMPMATRLWHWLRVLEDGADPDPTEDLGRRLRTLEQRLEALERR
ncbi:MAG: hypothetical protein OEN23_02840 [Paracoccaceae bacterium]|nr:hypothetical protein [Paracoccaceae bacterium]